MEQETFPYRNPLSNTNQAANTFVPNDQENVTMLSPVHRITIVDDDPIICEVLESLLSAWNFSLYTLPEPFLLSDLLKTNTCCDIFLLDVRLPNGTTLDWIPKIMDAFPEAKIIVMTGYTDTETVIQAIRNGAFDFLQKPISPELLKHTLNRAALLLERDRNLKQMLADLQQNQAQLLEQKLRLEFLNERLLETNRAFSTLAQNLDFERAEIISRISQKINATVVPSLLKIRNDVRQAHYAIEIDMIITMLQEVTFGTSPPDPLSASLTAAEARVASLIKKGLTTDKIAEQLFISVDTVKTHRKNIRKKLQITNSQNGLRDYLLNKTARA